MRSLSSKDLSSVLIELYRGSEQLPPDGYQDWALRKLQPYVPFDAGTWTTGYIDGSSLRPYRLHSVDLSPRMLQEYESLRLLDGLEQRAVDEPGTAVASAMCKAGTTAAFSSFCKRWRLAQGLAFAAVDPLTLLATSLTLYREPARPRFSDGERLLFETAAPHMIENQVMSTLSHMSRAALPGSSRILSSAVANRSGELQITMPEFQRLLLLEWPEWHDHRLPVAIRHLSAATKKVRYAGERIVVMASRMTDVSLIQVRGKLPVDDLSDREIQVARMMAGGLTYKEVAQKLGLAPATVRNHMSSIFAKLRVNKQSEMAAALSALD